MLHINTHLATYRAGVEEHDKRHERTALFDNPSDRHTVLGEKLQACILENPTN